MSRPLTPSDRWLGKLTALRPAQGKTKEQGVAPHKPLLLLCLIDLAEAGQIRDEASTKKTRHDATFDNLPKRARNCIDR